MFATTTLATHPCSDLQGLDSPCYRELEPPALAALIARGDGEALAETYRRFSSSLLGLALKVLGDRQDAEETVQEAFLYLWRRAGSYRPERASLSTWLTLITRSRAVDRLRSRHRRGQTETKMETDLGPIEGEEPPKSFDRLLDDERSRRVTDALRELPAAQREVLELCYWRGLTQREASERLGIPLGTVKTRTLLAMKKLREALGSEVGALL